MSAIERVQQVEVRVKKAALLIEKQRDELAQLKQQLELVMAHNEELQMYADSYKEDTRLIEESISKSLEALDSIEGLDDLNDFSIQNDFDVAESFEGGAAVTEDAIDAEDLF